MSRIDVFNGDADGICALQQIRLHTPAKSTLVTGVKRDIKLLDGIDAQAGDEVTVLDISLDKNRSGLIRLLDAGARVRYFDHHFAGEIPEHENLESHIDTSPDTCTSLLVDEDIDGAYRAWAVTAAFGDNFHDSARRAAEPLGLSKDDLSLLKELGELINYNAYGATVEDLHFAPAELYRKLSPYTDPLKFIREDEAFAKLRVGYAEDNAEAQGIGPESETEARALFILPAEPWARRVSGVFANELARANPNRAHAMLTRLPKGGFVVSVRAPLATKTGADALCRQFATGGGRQAAAGINDLPEDALEEFGAKFAEVFPGT
ncbi:MAG: acetyltransferase [Gammaproteobacteria bacterium]|jgi:hypothetical protein|nr:acetyltransferase [Gammaproteobacteria bacterium]